MKKKRTELSIPVPKWTVSTKLKETGPHEKTRISHLKYERAKVHTLTGHSGAEILQRTADEFNASNYAPVLSSTKLLHELPAAKRKELDDLCAKSVPDLFPVGSEVVA